MNRLLVIAIVIAASGAARGDVWKRAIDTGAPDAAQDQYDFEMRSGDEQAKESLARDIPLREMKHRIQLAEQSYRAAALSKPNEGEPYYRLGFLIYSHYFQCDTRDYPNPSQLCTDIYLDRAHVQEVIASWDAFEERAPLDPRLSVLAGAPGLLFQRAILHTKLATHDDLEAATHDYEKILARSDTSLDTDNETIWSNLAETYMMLGRLDDAIDTYREALRRGANSSTWFGLAVAFDRDERTAQARDVILSLGPMASREFFEKVMNTKEIFFVPAGEEFYYFALIEESFGQTDDAIDHWRKYIQSGAHREFQPRARAHLSELLAHKRPTPLPIHPPWPGDLLQ